MGGFFNGDDEYGNAIDKDSSIPRNQSWEITKEFHAKDWEETLERITAERKKGGVSLSLDFLKGSNRKVIAKIAQENGFYVSERHNSGSSSAWVSEYTAKVSWLGYRSIYKNHTSENQKEKTKKEPTVRDASWNQVKEIYSATKKQFKDGLDANIKKGYISACSDFDDKEIAEIHGQMFEEDGYFYDVRASPSLWDWWYWRSPRFELRVRVLNV